MVVLLLLSVLVLFLLLVVVVVLFCQCLFVCSFVAIDVNRVVFIHI